MKCGLHSEGEVKRLLFFSKYIFCLMFDYFLSFFSWSSVFCVPLCFRFLCVSFRFPLGFMSSSFSCAFCFMGLDLDIFQFLVSSY